MSSPDGKVTVVFNGEIYNYRELAKQLTGEGHRFQTTSDTEVLLKLYEARGMACVEELHGMFAFAVHDGRRNSLFLARDRMGKKPLYYCHPTRDSLLFASELKGLAPLCRAAQMDLRVRDQSIYDYLSFGVVPQPNSIYEGVHCLPPGNTAIWEGETLTLQEYWSPSYEPKSELDYNEAQAEVRLRLHEAVRLRLRSDVPLGVLLSGGLDSSIVAYESVQAGVTDLQTFTIATPGGLDESGVASRTAHTLGVENTVLPLEVDPLAGVQAVVHHYDQPFADSSAIPSMQIARLARQHVTVVLNGDGGDEVFAGYRRYAAATLMPTSQRLAHLSAPAAKALSKFASNRRTPFGFAARFASGLGLDGPDRYLAWGSDLLRESDKDWAWQGQGCHPSERLVGAHATAGLSSLDQMVATDVRLNLLSDLLVKMDMATMASSLEARSPFLDQSVAELGWHLPVSYRVKGFSTKRILRDAYREALPDEVVNGSKKGFEVPLAAWLAGPLAEIIHDTLGSPNAKVRAYVSAELIEGLLSSTLLEDRNDKTILYSLLVLELWLTQQGVS
ncbi:MAG: asnB [Marmoricola sp.]|nr:asnB [Marmoricola sp.]